MENKGLWIGVAFFALVIGLVAGFLVGKKKKKCTCQESKENKEKPEMSLPGKPTNK